MNMTSEKAPTRVNENYMLTLFLVRHNEMNIHKHGVYCSNTEWKVRIFEIHNHHMSIREKNLSSKYNPHKKVNKTNCSQETAKNRTASISNT
jgi:hypothetical protein